MKSLFQRRIKDGEITPSPMEKLMTAFEWCKCRLADFLNARLARLSPKNQRRLLLSLGLVITAICIVLIVHAYHGGEDVLKTIGADRIVQPPLPVGRALDEIDRQMLRDFQAMMDSLDNSPYGKEIYEQIKRERPGLLDTINMLLKVR